MLQNLLRTWKQFVCHDELDECLKRGTSIKWTLLLCTQQYGKLIILACFWQNKSFWSLAGERLILWRVISALPEPSVTYQPVWSWWGSWGGGLCWSNVSSSSGRSCAGCHISETPSGCSSHLQSARTASAWSWAGRSEWAAAAGCSSVCGCPNPKKQNTHTRGRKGFVKNHSDSSDHIEIHVYPLYGMNSHVFILRSSKNWMPVFNLSDFVPHTVSSFWENAKHGRHSSRIPPISCSQTDKFF